MPGLRAFKAKKMFMRLAIKAGTAGAKLAAKAVSRQIQSLILARSAGLQATALAARSLLTADSESTQPRLGTAVAAKAAGPQAVLFLCSNLRP